MDTREYVGLEPTNSSLRWELRIEPKHCSGHGTLFGGVGLGAAAIAAAEVAERPLVWATGQFVAQAVPGELLSMDVQVLAEGRKSTQIRVRCHVEDREILGVYASLGQRDVPETHQFVEMPIVPDPLNCPLRNRLGGSRSALADVEQRLAIGSDQYDAENPVPDGRSALWFKTPRDLEVDTGFLAIVGDFVPWGARQAMQTYVGSTSLDNTIRVARPVPTEWVLADTRITSVHNGYAHGDVHLWSQDGTLMATASQTAQLREIRNSN
jgi:acyl-CoA thioesterase-2